MGPGCLFMQVLLPHLHLLHGYGSRLTVPLPPPPRTHWSRTHRYGCGLKDESRWERAWHEVVLYCSTLMAAATAKGRAWRDQLVKVLMEATLGQPAPRPDEACKGGLGFSQAPPPLQELLQGCAESVGMPDLLPALMHSDSQRQQDRGSGGGAESGEAGGGPGNWRGVKLEELPGAGASTGVRAGAPIVAQVGAPTIILAGPSTSGPAGAPTIMKSGLRRNRSDITGTFACQSSR